MKNLIYSRASLATRVVPAAFLVAAIGLGARPAHAIYADIATSGVIQSGTDTSGLFGVAGRNLASLGYTMDLVFDSPGSFTYATTTDATTSGFATGSVTVRIGGVSFTTAFTDSYGSYLEQTPHEITASNTGDDTAGSALSVTNQFSTATSLLPVNLGAPFSYSGQPGDLAGNGGAVTFSVFGGMENASFVATPGSVTYTVAEPASIGLLVAGLALAGLGRRRSRAKPSDIRTVEPRS